MIEQVRLKIGDGDPNVIDLDAFKVMQATRVFDGVKVWVQAKREPRPWLVTFRGTTKPARHVPGDPNVFQVWSDGIQMQKDQPALLTERAFKKLKRLREIDGLVYDAERLSKPRTPFSNEYPLHLAELGVTVVIPSFRYLDVLQDCVKSWHKYYPEVPLIVVEDAGGSEETDAYVRHLNENDPQVVGIVREENGTHGVTLATGIERVKTKRFLTFDNDAVILARGFLEMMESAMIVCDLYAVGRIESYIIPNGQPHPFCALFDTKTYRSLPPFVASGKPFWQNMEKAHERGLKMECFQPERGWGYVKHWGGVSRCRFSGGLWSPYAPVVRERGLDEKAHDRTGRGITG